MSIVLLDLSILATDTRVRGIGRYASELALGLKPLFAQDRHLELRLLESIDWDGTPRISDDPEAAVARLTSPSRPIVGGDSWGYRLRLGLSSAARKAGAALVHLPHASATPLFKGGALRVVTCHDLIPLRYADHYLRWTSGYAPGRRLLDLRRYGTADHVVAISRATASDLDEILSIGSDKVTVVPNGIDVARFSPDDDGDDAARRERLGAVAPYLLYAGDADWRKNSTGMFAALALARREIPSLTLVWAGKLSPEREARVRREAADAGVSGAVRLLGWVPDDDLLALYRGAHAMLFVSRAEGFGLPVVEAMASGCPVVTSDSSSLREIAEGAALLVNPESPREIADAVLALVDHERRHTLRRAGLTRARRYSLDTQARRMLQLYHSLVG